MRRLLTAASLVALILTVASPVAVPGVRIPRNAADWATFTSAERSAAIAYEWQIHLAQVAQGAVQTTSVRATVRAGAISPNVTATGTCKLQWINQAEGTWTRAGGWTDASEIVAYIYAGRTAGSHYIKLIRDGTTIKTTFNERTNDDWAEAWTGYDWKWWFEHPHYVGRSYHGARVGSSTWILGPDKQCTVQADP